jgi:hypothetical protein
MQSPEDTDRTRKGRAFSARARAILEDRVEAALGTRIEIVPDDAAPVERLRLTFSEFALLMLILFPEDYAEPAAVRRVRRGQFDDSSLTEVESDSSTGCEVDNGAVEQSIVGSSRAVRNSEWLSLEEACAMARCSRATLFRWLKAKWARSRKIKGERLIDRAAFEKFLNTTTTEDTNRE